jgi:hypothetical protein
VISLPEKIISFALLGLTLGACTEEPSRIEPPTPRQDATSIVDTGPSPQRDTGWDIDGGQMGPDSRPMDAGQAVDTGPMAMDASLVNEDATSAVDTGPTPRRDTGWDIDGGQTGPPEAGVFTDTGLPGRDANWPSRDGGLPWPDGGLPSFDANFPIPDSGTAQTTISVSTSMPVRVWLNLMPIVAADPLRAEVTVDYNNGGTTNDMISVTQAYVIIAGTPMGNPPIPQTLIQSFAMAPDQTIPPGGITTKTLNKVLGTGMPNSIMMPAGFCNQQAFVTLEFSNGQAILGMATVSCVF